MRNFYLVGILFCMLMSGRSMLVHRSQMKKPTVATPSLALNAPYFTPDNWNYYVIQTDISFRVSRNNPTGVLEVWRSKTAEENYVLAGTATSEFFTTTISRHAPNSNTKCASLMEARSLHGAKLSIRVLNQNTTILPLSSSALATMNL